MKTNVQELPTARPTSSSEFDAHFVSEVRKRSGVDFTRCLHCRSCAGGCPFFEAMDYAPNALIRLAQLGLKQEALTCSTIWICVGCHTCSVQCPQAVDIPAVMDSLRQMALEEKITVAEPDILNFHREVLSSIQRYGRTHKLEIMLRYKLKKRNWLADLDVGLKMLARRKLDLLPSRTEDMEEIKKMFGNK